MTKPVRPGLDALPFATKKTAPADAPVTAAAPAEVAKGKTDDRVTIIIRVPDADRVALKVIAAEQRTTIQDMMASAIADIIRRSR